MLHANIYKSGQNHRKAEKATATMETMHGKVHDKMSLPESEPEGTKGSSKILNNENQPKCEYKEQVKSEDVLK